MKLIAGLGNPGATHLRNRHNIGFMAVDAIAESHDIVPFRERHGGLAATGRVNGTSVMLLKPLTFMNESGRAVGAALRYHRMDSEDLIVIHDEIDLAPGKVRIKTGGGIAGHNGLRSIRAHVGDDFQRVRIGVGHPGERHRVTGYVLGNFRAEDAAWRDPLLERLADALPDLLDGDESRFASRIGARGTVLQPGENRNLGRESV